MLISNFNTGLKAMALLQGKDHGVVVQIGANNFWLGS